jgi:acyl-CoA reductase-like NAD-dependent aldehyde dehydrogenase
LHAVEAPVSFSATQLLIDNHWVPSESEKAFAIINPTIGDKICQVTAADTVDVDRAVRAARRAFE